MPSYLVSAKESFVPTEMYTPPVQTLGEMLRIKQGQYDQGYNQVNSGRNAIYDAEVLSADGNAKKQQYINQAQKTLQQLSQADLSLPENVKMADEVFKPFWEDRVLTDEIGKIRKVNKEIDLGEQMRTSTDKELREGYNPFSIQDLNNQKQEIAESTAEERKSMQARSYAKKVDISKEMDAGLEKIGGQKGSITEDINGGGYKYINQYGKQAVLPLTEFYMNSLSTDARNYLHVMGRLEARGVYQQALAMTGGDKNAAKTMVAEDVMRSEADNINTHQIPEINRQIDNTTSNIKALLLKRQQTKSELTPEEADYIKSQAQSIENQKTSVASLQKKYAELTDKKAPDYLQNVEAYKADTNNHYIGSVTSRYANGWAKSRAAVLATNKIEEDKTYMGLQQIKLGYTKEENDFKQLGMTLESREKLKGLKAAGDAATAAGQQGGPNGSTGIYIGQNPNGNQLVNKYENYAGVATQLRVLTVEPTIGMFQKTANSNFNFSFLPKLVEGFKNGKDKEAFFNSKTADNDPFYKEFKAAFDANKLATKPGQKYAWTYQQVFDTLQDTLMDWSKTEEGQLKIGTNGMKEFDLLTKCGDAYKATKEDQAILHKEVLKDPKYTGFITTKDGLERLMTDQELIGETTVPMRLSSDFNKVVNVKINDILRNSSTIKMINAAHGYDGVNIDGQIYEAADHKTSKTLSNLHDKGWEGAQDIKSDELKKLKDLKSQFLTDFDKVAPKLQTATTLKLDALNYGIQQYRAADKKNTTEQAEVAASNLLSDENLRAANSQFIGAGSSDLKEGSDFMKLIHSVNSYISTGTEEVAVNASAYDTEAGGKAFKILMKPEDLYKALGTTADKATDGQKKAIELFQSPSFRIKPPEHNQMPGGILTGSSPLVNMVRRSGYETSKYMDDVKMGGFKLEKQAVGGFALKMWTYVPNAKTGELEKTSYDDASVPQTFSDATDIEDLMTNLHSVLQNQFTKNRAYAQAHPAVPKGQGVSIQSVLNNPSVKNLGLNL